MLTENEGKPRFMLAAEELARQRGTEWREVLHQDREGVRTSGYPSPECLLPDELESYFSEGAGLAANRAGHVATCPACASLLANAGADPVEAQKILELVRDQRTSAAEERRGDQTGAGIGRMTKWVSILGGAAAVAFWASRKLKRQTMEPAEPVRPALDVLRVREAGRESHEAPASLI